MYAIVMETEAGATPFYFTLDEITDLRDRLNELIESADPRVH